MVSTALIIIDFQKEWIDKNSDYFVGDISEIVNKTNKLIDYCRLKGYKIIFTKHIEKNSEGSFAEDSENVEIIEKIKKKGSDIVVIKNKISPFYKTTLEKELKGIKNIITAGILTNLCVRSLIEEAYDRDFEITVIKDCCVSIDKSTQDFTFKDLKATREEVEFFNLDEFIKKH